MAKMHSKIEEVYSDLRKQIINRSIPPGTRISDSRLSTRWNVSRTPIREVLRRLESEGLVTSYPHRGFIVNTITIQDIEQLYTIKINLEGLAGRLATPIISSDPKKLKILDGLCEDMESLFKKGDIETYTKKNDEFHYYIWNSCGNRWLIKILENLSSQVSRFIVKALQIPNRMKKSVKEHWEIHRNLKMRDSKGVEKAIANHFQNSFDDLRNELMMQA
jgi:DNA-binding GntR family transcriptional regulator